MARLAVFALLTGLIARVYSLGLKFVNPPPYDSNDGLENHPAYKEDANLDVEWTMEDDSRLIYLVLNQVKMWGLDQADSGEFIMRMNGISSMTTCEEAEFKSSGHFKCYKLLLGCQDECEPYHVEPILSQHLLRRGFSY